MNISIEKKTYVKWIVFLLAGLFMLSMAYWHKASVGISAAAASTKGRPIPVISYETGRDYDFTECEPVEMMSYGKRSLGTLRISGKFNADTNYNNVPAYGVESGTLTLDYDYDGYLLNSNGAHYLESDDRLFGDSPQKGRLEIQKSTTGIEWKKAVNPVVNFFEANSTGKENLYTINGGELAKGMYFRVIISYETKKSSGSTFKPDAATYHVELYEFFACYNSGTISVHDLAKTIDAVNNMKDSGYTAEQISKGETIKDGGTTVKGFSIDTLGSSYNVKVNGKDVSNGDKFTENGRYEIKVKTKLGKETSMTVYVFDGGSDNGRSTYFEDYLVTEKRIFREGYTMVFARNAVMELKHIPDYVPLLTGTIKNVTTGDKVIDMTGDTIKEMKNNKTSTTANDRARKIFSLSPGDYVADLYSGDISSGSCYHYQYIFTVLDESAEPYVNKHNIDVFERQMDFKPKHYEVAYETAGGGSIYVCFDSYDEAYRYAYDIEKRALEYTDSGIRYWVDKGKSNQKERYASETKSDKLKLTRLLAENAEKNIEIAYFDPTTSFSSQTINILGMTDADIDKDLEEMSVRESVRLFSDEKHKEQLKDDGLPIINGYKFMKIGGGEYDAKTITAESPKLGEAMEISTDISIDKQHLPSDVIKISEKNKYGDKNSYDVVYLAGNTTFVTLNTINNGKEMLFRLSPESEEEIVADAVTFVDITNELDRRVIVNIESDVYAKEDTLTCYAEELKGLVLYKKGKYRVTFIDRAGKRYTLKLMLTGLSSYNDLRTGSTRTYPEIFNDVHIARKIKEDN